MNKELEQKIHRIDTLLKILRRGKWEFEGEEALAFYQVYDFFVRELINLRQQNEIDEIKPLTEPIKKI